MDNEKDLKVLREKIRLDEERFHLLLEHVTEGIIIISPSGLPVYVSPTVEKIFGYSEEELYNTDLSSLGHPDEMEESAIIRSQIINNPGIPFPGLVSRRRHKNGHWIWVEATITNMLDNPAINGIVNNFRDITARVLAKEQLIYSNRLYKFISHINQVIVHEKEEQSLFTEACRIAIECGGFRFAWIGLVEPGSKKINIAASWDATPADTNFFKNYTYDEGGPIERVLSGEDFFVITDIQQQPNDNFNAYAKSRGYKSAICLSLKKSGKIVGTFNMYSSEKHFFTPTEIALLKEVTLDISFALDVFEKEKQRTEAEQALLQKEFRLRQAQAIAHLGNWELDVKTGKSIWSEEVLRIFGLPIGETTQSIDTWLSFIHPEDLENVLNAIRQREITKKSTNFHYRIIRNDGTIRYIYNYSSYEFDGAGEPTLVTGITHDITELKIAESNVLKIAAEKNTILESIGDAFFAVDGNWIVTYWNKMAEQLLRTPKSKILGQYLWDVFDKNAGPKSYENYHKAMESGEVIHFQEYYAPLECWFEISVYPAINALSVYFKDISERIDGEISRLKMVDDIVQRNKDLEQFSFMISHNLRAPVANIIGLAAELNEEEHSAEVKNILKKELTESSKRLDEVIGDINSILHLKRERKENKDQVDFSELVNSIRLSIADMIESNHVVIMTNFKAAENVLTTKSYMYSIFFNLITNSIKYRQPNLAPRIEITSRKTSESTIVEFRDNGLGINIERQKDQIFGLYRRFHQHVEGKGLGLFMVKTQVEILGGIISIESKVNAGTCFTIEFFNQ
jgi:PAS domain S-box-containing protein